MKQTIDEMVEEFEDTEYSTGNKPNQNSAWLRTKLEQAIAQRDKEILEMMENTCMSEDGDKIINFINNK